MLVQVPPCTNFHALPWKSMVDVPWQVVPGPAAQSFWPLSATPKHFSFFAATAASTSALVRGAAAATVASAVDTAPASTSELMVVFIYLSTWVFIASSAKGAHRLVRFVHDCHYGMDRSRVREVSAVVTQTIRYGACSAFRYRLTGKSLQCLVAIETKRDGHWRKQ